MKKKKTLEKKVSLAYTILITKEKFNYNQSTLAGKRERFSNNEQTKEARFLH